MTTPNRFLLLPSMLCAALCLGTLGGCNNCEKLEEKMCTDLGPEGCEHWKTLGKPGVPTGRGANNMCGNAIDDDVYPKLFDPIKKSVEQSQPKK